MTFMPTNRRRCPGAIRALALFALIWAPLAQAATDALATAALSYEEGHLIRALGDHLAVSEDQGRGWRDLPLPATAKGGPLTAAVLSPVSPSTLYITGPEIGVQRSDDWGQHWRSIQGDLPSTDVIAFTPHRTQPDTLYAVLADIGIHRSEDGGKTWRLMDSGPTQGIQWLIHSDMPGSMQTGWLVAGSATAVRLSMDCFCGWRLGGDFESGPVHSVIDLPGHPEHWIAATDTGLFHSDNGGQQWQALTETNTPLVALTAVDENTLLALTAQGRLLTSEDQGRTWNPDE
ncbi:WD40/YVTN/BNR-like repeat-containing protein [Alloalcanivorax balearicus]|nr:hypothetical protein [Alloalcanivorax balearicus]